MNDFSKCSREEILHYRPEKGNALIYRYYDNDGSYVGQTVQSLAERAGKDGKNYNHGKFGAAIFRKRYRSFKVEILEECSVAEADDKEKFYIQQFNSAMQGYNSTTGGNYNRSQEGVGEMPEFNTRNREEFLDIISQPDYQMSCTILEENCNENTVYFAGCIDYADANFSPDSSFFFHGAFSRCLYEFDEEELLIKPIPQNIIKGTIRFHLCGRQENFYDSDLFDSNELPADTHKDFAKRIASIAGEQLSMRLMSMKSESEIEKLVNIQRNLVTFSYTFVVGPMKEENIAPAWMLTWRGAEMRGPEIIYNGTSFIKGYIYFEGAKDNGYYVAIRDYKEICALDDDSPLLKLKPRDFAKEALNLEYDAFYVE